jgi:Glycosyl transferases group 1
VRRVTGLLRARMAARARAADLRWRRPPALEVYPATGVSTVYYLVPHLPQPTGGVKVMYQHVDLLNEMGIAAAVLHEPDGFRAGWFANQTRIESATSIRLRANDILVIPECYSPGFGLLPEQVRKYVFNQAAYHTFDLVDGDPYAGVPNLLGLLTVSRDSADLLRFTFPGLAVFGTRPIINNKIFHRGPQPLRRLAFLPDRRTAERHQLRGMLRARGVDWELAPISGMTEAEVARTMRESAIFLSFSEREGFGLPPAEAMASGCFVIGYDGGGGREFFDPAYSAPVSDQLGFARAVVEAVQRPLDELSALGAKASEHVLGTYTLDGLRSDLAAAFGSIT